MGDSPDKTQQVSFQGAEMQSYFGVRWKQFSMYFLAEFDVPHTNKEDTGHANVVSPCQSRLQFSAYSNNNRD